MTAPLKLLVVEDVEADYRLVLRTLTRHGYALDARRVDRLDALADALAVGGWDLVISDYNLPGMDFAACFERVRALPELPIILLSGSVGEERAVELLKSGVADFVLKSNLGRLPPAVDRCLRERAESRARAEAERALAGYRAQLEALVATRTEELRQRERDLQAILDNMPALIGYWDSGLRNRFANQAYHDWLGIPAGGLRGMHKRDALGPQRYEYVRPGVETALRGEPAFLEGEFPPADGSRRYTQTHYIPDLRDGLVQGLYVLVTDITDLKLAEQAAEAARREAERLARAKADFLANMSHEIRTPLNAVLGFAEAGLDQSDDRRVHETLHRILDAGQLLLGVVDDVLDYSKIEAGKLALEDAPFAPGEVIDRAVDVLAGRARERGVELLVDEAPDLPAASRGDALRLAQVLMNLLSNAIKFTERGGRVELAARHDGTALCFTVADTGIGMQPEQAARLFQPFEQADGSITRRFGGTGLGLAICARLVALMGGTIGVDSRPGAGCRFEVRVPLPVLAAVAPVLPPGRVALAGLDAAESRALTVALAAHGCEATVVAAGAPLPAHTSALVCTRGTDDGLAASVLAAGRRLVLVGAAAQHQGPLPATLRTSVCVERPLRPRHVLAALAAAPPSVPAPAAHTHRLDGVALLVVEDNETNRLLLDMTLAREGARLTLAENGRRALECLHAAGPDAFDLVLTDLQMPEMDGYETARRIVACAPDLPVLGLSAHALPEERARCLAAGMVDQLTRPIAADALVAALRRYRRVRPAGPADTGAASGVCTAPAPAASASASASASPASPASSAAAAAVTAAAEPIDWAAIERDFPDRPDFLRRLIDTVFASHDDVPARLADARAKGDLAALGFIAHGLKGMGGTLHAGPLRALATRAEAHARAGDAGAWALLPALEVALAALLDELGARRRQL